MKRKANDQQEQQREEGDGGREDLNSSETSIDADGSNFSPDRCSETLTLTTTTGIRKGKEKIGENDIEIIDSTDMMSICGICLYEDDGRAIRGRIDSCDHFFCFVCIMEWAKVESRCPMCKARFTTIRRPPKDGIFATERIVNVPVRDQVSLPLGNGTDGPGDPYAQARCIECHGVEDENLLLLCDLCDSAAHTYCVGLEATVPEGDWYCHDCSVMRNEHSNSQMDTESCNQDFPRNFDTTRVAETYVSISDIIREGTASDEVPQRKSSNCQILGNQIGNNIPSKRNKAAKESQGSKSPPPALPVREPEQSARTLHHCRNLHGRIRTLRENWDSMQSGSLRFTSSASNNRRHSSGTIIPNKSSQPLSFSSPNHDSASNDMLNKWVSYDVDRAWKMMEIAKSVQNARGGTGFDQKNPGSLALKRKVPLEATSSSSSSFTSTSKSFNKEFDSIISEKKCKNYFLEPLHEDSKYQQFEKQKTRMDVMKGLSQIDRGPPGSCFSEYHESQSSKQVEKSCNMQGGHGNAKLSIPSVQDAPPCPSSAADSLPRGPDLSVGSRKSISASSCKIHPLNVKRRWNQNCEVIVKKDDSAKSEIQSLVKLNLKMLSCDRPLGIDKFKEIARLATHTILAACGLEHSKSIARPFPISVCRHFEQSQQLRASNLMPSSCRECFYVFVKDVVNSIMAEKVILTASS